MINYSMVMAFLIFMPRQAIPVTAQANQKARTPNPQSDSSKSNIEPGQPSAFHSFRVHAWPTDGLVPVKIIRAARKANVDFSLYPMFPPPPAPSNEKGLGNGWQQWKGDPSHFYQDKSGTRLILEVG